MTGHTTPAVSVLMTVYNYRQFVAEAIQSVVASTFEDWELIIVDDGSTDGSLAIAQEHARTDGRLRVIPSRENRGDYPARNLAASAARGKYLKYLDADDVIYPHGLGVMVSAMERYSEAGLGLSHNVIDDDLPYPQQISPREAYISHFLGRDVLSVGPSAAILRRDIFEKVGGFSGRQYVGDTELWLKLAALAPVVKLPPALVWWRQHEGQQIRAEGSNPSIAAIRHRLSLEALEGCGTLLTEDEKRLARRWRIYRHARHIWRGAVKHGQLLAAWPLVRESRLTPWQMCHALVRQQQPEADAGHD